MGQWQLAEEGQTRTLRWPEKSSCYYLSNVSSLQCFGVHNIQESRSFPAQTRCYLSIGKRYLLKTTETAPFSPPSLHNVLPPISGKEVFLPMAWCSALFYCLEMEVWHRCCRKGRKDWQVRWEQHTFSPVFISIAAFTVQWWSWVVATECAWLTKPNRVTMWPFKEKVYQPLVKSIGSGDGVLRLLTRLMCVFENYSFL